ncbi:hypothetical protein ACLOJK_012876 [Asimina triloba]
MPIAGKCQEQPLPLFFFFLSVDEKPIERIHRQLSAPNLRISFTVVNKTHLSFFSRSDEKTHLTTSRLPRRQRPSMAVRQPLLAIRAWIFSGRKPICIATTTATTCCCHLRHRRPAKPIAIACLSEETHLLAADLHAPTLLPDLADHQSSKISAPNPHHLLSFDRPPAHQICCSPYDHRHGRRVLYV